MDFTVHDPIEEAVLCNAKLTAARDIASAVLQGRIDSTPQFLDALAGLVAACARHARRAEAA